VTNDIAVALRTPTQHADEIKLKYACALTQLASPDETIEVPSIGDRPPRRLSRQTLAEVVEPRYEELLTLIQAELRRSGYEDLVAGGVVLTGGSSKMEGLIDLAEEVFHMPVRLGIPQIRIRPGRRGAQPDPRDGRGPVAVWSSQSCGAGSGDGGWWWIQVGFEPYEELVSGQFLIDAVSASGLAGRSVAGG
jgi:cell division ATPase FtsA